MGLRLAIVGFFILAAAADSLASSSVPVAPGPAEEPASYEAAAEIFRRAFWRNPSTEDRILHALRTEERDEQGTVKSWAWWIALEPGSAFREWLLRENPFGLVVVSSNDGFEPPGEAPAWFPSAAALRGTVCHRVPTGRLWVFLDPASGRLFATDSGLGFNPPAKKEPPFIPGIADGTSGPAPTPSPGPTPFRVKPPTSR